MTSLHICKRACSANLHVLKLKLYALEDNKQDLIIFIFFGFLLEDSTEDRYANKHYANNIINEYLLLLPHSNNDPFTLISGDADPTKNMKQDHDNKLRRASRIQLQT